MFGFLRARAQVKAVHAVIHACMPNTPMAEPALRVAQIIVDLQLRASIAELEVRRLRATYEPTRRRVSLPDGSTIVQPTGARESST